MFILLISIIVINVLVYLWVPHILLYSAIITLFFFLFFVNFFRNPKREISISDNTLVYAPADGKIVAIEETDESEYFKDQRLQISIFMSVTNVHVNRNPIGGVVRYYKYHPGKYMAAWNPKSSLENERTTIVIDNGNTEILIRQIAGALARRIINYLKVGLEVKQGEDMGFIKLGSRVDVFLPKTANIKIDLHQQVKGNQTVLAIID